MIQVVYTHPRSVTVTRGSSMLSELSRALSWRRRALKHIGVVAAEDGISNGDLETDNDYAGKPLSVGVCHGLRTVSL